MRRKNLVVFGAVAASGVLACAVAGCAADERLNPAPQESFGVGGAGGNGGGDPGTTSGAGGQGGQAGPGGQGGGGGAPTGEVGVIECGIALPPPPAAGTCIVSKEGTGATRFRGTVLGPEKTLHQGEVMIDAKSSA